MKESVPEYIRRVRSQPQVPTSPTMSLTRWPGIHSAKETSHQRASHQCTGESNNNLKIWFLMKVSASGSLLTSAFFTGRLITGENIRKHHDIHDMLISIRLNKLFQTSDWHKGELEKGLPGNYRNLVEKQKPCRRFIWSISYTSGNFNSDYRNIQE